MPKGQSVHYHRLPHTQTSPGPVATLRLLSLSSCGGKATDVNVFVGVYCFFDIFHAVTKTRGVPYIVFILRRIQTPPHV